MTALEALCNAKKTVNSALDAELLLCAVLGISRSELLAAPKTEIPSKILNRYNKALEKRKQGFCVAAITGNKQFRFLDLAVNRHVFIPRPDTETLVEAALFWLNSASIENPKALDLCTGTGAVALALLDETQTLAMTAVDISRHALLISRKNYAMLCKKRASLKGKFRLLKSDLFSKVSGLYNLITANPPYVPCAEIETLAPEVKNEPRLALDGGADGLSLIRRICKEAPSYLSPGGAIFIEAGPDQMRQIAALLEEASLCIIDIYSDLAGNQRVIGAKKN
jgi:release factor glutamine methyltransferase